MIVKDIGFQEEFLEYTPNAMYYRYVGAGAILKNPMELEIPIDLLKSFAALGKVTFRQPVKCGPFSLISKCLKEGLLQNDPTKYFSPMMIQLCLKLRKIPQII